MFWHAMASRRYAAGPHQIAKTTLVFKTTVPKLNCLSPDAVTLDFTFSLDGAGMNPLFLQEISNRIRARPLVQLNNAWTSQFRNIARTSIPSGPRRL
ncbi:MAG: hypothetical protein NTX73_18220 [Rhodobacterales bacterium]|nr:hypothetical protein [Rhodobacterales bacterium]